MNIFALYFLFRARVFKTTINSIMYTAKGKNVALICYLHADSRHGNYKKKHVCIVQFIHYDEFSNFPKSSAIAFGICTGILLFVVLIDLGRVIYP